MGFCGYLRYFRSQFRMMMRLKVPQCLGMSDSFLQLERKACGHWSLVLLSSWNRIRTMIKTHCRLYLSIYLSIRPSIHLSINLLIYPYIHLSIQFHTYIRYSWVIFPFHCVENLFLLPHSANLILHFSWSKETRSTEPGEVPRNPTINHHFPTGWLKP